ncbi:MAG TPA: MBL fold metallo-hydrolase [Candidatus Caldiarchaeum subterraneum]|uniref:MBL fold metallo-hydrolase n=1 Tax=Caldiarchaeum subterraneum TaxID=311458 RepID=A0A833ECK6_CALS0|nr:MBL fold metallo-hydrolase [Candidatus Caldarchaeum subterraneum]
MPRLRVYGGADEIGGNKVLIESGDSRVFLDFGMSFSAKRRFFGTFIQPPSFALVNDYLLTGVIPSIRGIYKRELLRYGEASKLVADEPTVDAVMISHAHLDHVGHTSLLRNDIPIFMGEGTKIILEAREESRTSLTIENKIIKHHNNIKTFRTNSKIKIGDYIITPIHVDHSVPAAYGFYIDINGYTLAYTGDLRMHGPKGDMTQEFIEYCTSKSVDTLIIEGTRIDEKEIHSEHRIHEEMKKLISSASDKLVVLMMGLLDFDRIRSVLSASNLNDRTLVVPLRQAYLLDKLKREDPALETPEFKPGELAIYHERRGAGEYSDTDYKGWMKNFLNYLTDKGYPLVRDYEINENPSKFVFVINMLEDVLELARIKPPAGSPFVLSTSEPHNEEQMLEMEKLMNWINLFNMRYNHLHASGHASASELIQIIENIQPRRIIPIHTEKPMLFREYLKNTEAETRITIPKTGEEILL